MTVIPDEKTDALLKQLHEIDAETDQLGLHAYVWNVEKMA
jgi:hypothetical protein